MKRMMLLFVGCMLLSGCSQQHDAGDKAPMLRLQLLLVQSASLATLPGELARKHAAELARRAMSGPEMNAMHHGGGADQPMMKATHDLGDAVFEVLEAGSSNRGMQSALEVQVQLAAQAAQMRLSGNLLGGDTGAFMQSKGQSLLASDQEPVSNAYGKAVAHLLALLRKTG